MAIRSTALALAGAAVLASVAVTATSAHADAWRFVTQYKTLPACKNAANDLIARHKAREFKCENDYNEAGDPALDLYVR